MITVGLTSSASGKMLPHFQITKSKAGKIKKLPVEECSIKMKSYCSIKGWTNYQIMLNYLEDIIIPHSNKNNTLLIMDSYGAHYA